MKNRLLAFLVSLSTSLIVCSPSLSSSADPAPSEAAVRKADAEWASSTASANAWMSFYAADAIVLLPHAELANGKELVRQSVSRLLALPHLSLVWRPIEVKMAASGDVALLTAVYEQRFDEQGAPVSNRGRRLEIWKKQSDGSWKCIVDTWNLDEPMTAPAALPPAVAQGASPTSTPAAPVARTAPPPPPAAPESAAAPRDAAKYGDMPAHYEQAIRQYFLEHLKHPESVQTREITQPEQGYTTGITGGLLMREKRDYGWKVKATINTQDSHQRYVGFKTYTFLFRGETIADVRLPLPADEMN